MFLTVPQKAKRVSYKTGGTIQHGVGVVSTRLSKRVCCSCFLLVPVDVCVVDGKQTSKASNALL